MPEEIHELHEHAEHGAHDPALAKVTVTMAILAVLVAAVGLLGHRAHTEEIILQTSAADQWAYYQAKDTRLKNDEILLEELNIFALQDQSQVEEVRAKYEKEADKYDQQRGDIQAEARKMQAERGTQQRRADRFDLGEVLLEAALVICSITLLSRKQIYWIAGVLLGFVGLGIATAGFLIR